MEKDELVQELLRIRRERDQLAAQLKLESKQHESELSALKRRVLELERNGHGSHQKNNTHTSAGMPVPLQTTADFADKDGVCTTVVQNEGLPAVPELLCELATRTVRDPGQETLALEGETVCTSRCGDTGACASTADDAEIDHDSVSIEGSTKTDLQSDHVGPEGDVTCDKEQRFKSQAPDFQNLVRFNTVPDVNPLSPAAPSAQLSGGCCGAEMVNPARPSAISTHNSPASDHQGHVSIDDVPYIDPLSRGAPAMQLRGGRSTAKRVNPSTLSASSTHSANLFSPNAPSTSGGCVRADLVNSEVADGVRIELTLLGSEVEISGENTVDMCNVLGKEAEPLGPRVLSTQESVENSRVTEVKHVPYSSQLTNPLSPTAPSSELNGGGCGAKRVHDKRVTRARRYKNQVIVHGSKYSQSVQHQVDRNRYKDQKPHKCTHCGVCFTYYGSLYRHLRTHSQKRVNNHTDDKVYKCEETECGEAFTEHRQLVAHMTKHTGVKPYKCEDCDAAFTTARALRVHTLTHHADKTRVRKYQCTECSKRFFHKGHLKDHVNIHSGKRPYKCAQCGKCFKQSGALRMHRAVHTQDRPFACQLCDAKFKQRGQLNVHIATHSDEKAHQCELCGVRLRSKWALQQHAIVHTDDRPYKCDFCNATFKRPESLKIHIEGHSGEKKHLCSVCGAKFTTAASCRVHMRSHTGEKPYKCAVCGAAFSHHYALSEHKGLHTDERRYKCDECGKSFRFSSNLRAHKLTHGNSRPHKCSTCGDTFKTPYSLKKHLATHSAETPYECMECGAAFALPERLKRHQRTHLKQREDAKPKAEQGVHLCDICGATFSKAKSLVDHRASKHAVQKPQDLTSANPAPHSTRCVECGAGFALEKHLKSHMRTHNGQKLHKCPTCGAGFNSARTLREHARTHPQNLTCEECGATFDRVKKLQGHRLAHLKASGQCKRAQSNASKPFQCQDCGRGFGTAKRLKYHKCVHGAEKPYKCTQCAASFLRVRYLMSHMLTHSGDKPFVCEICCSSFASSFALSAHKGRVHTVSKQSQNAQDAAVILSEMYAT